MVTLRESVRHAGRYATRAGVLCLAGIVPFGAAGAANKSGVEPNVIQLPSGPGSLRGLGDTIETDLNAGSASYGIEIVVPPGTAELTPGISLEYDSGNGNGILGIGWDTGVPFVQRKTSRGIPRYIDEDNEFDDDYDGEIDEPDERDRFINDLGENLIPRDDGYWFAQRESEFTRYERTGDSWTGTTGDGVVLEFGASENSRLYDEATGRVFAWFLEREVDLWGNVIEYEYTRFDNDQNTNQVYLKKITYGPGEPPWLNHHFVVFEYEPRPDWFEVCESAFVVRTGMRLKRIRVGTQGPELTGHALGDFDEDGTDDHLNRIYELAYDTDPHWSLLSSVTEIGADGVSALPATTFEYTRCNLPDVFDMADIRIGSMNTPQYLMDNEQAELLDVNGDALADIIKTDAFGGAHTAYVNLGPTEDENGNRVIAWSDGIPMGGDARARQISLSESAGNAGFFADMNGDGRADLVYKTGSDVYYFPAIPDPVTPAWGERTRINLHPTETVPSFPFEGQGVVSDDINGNLRSDLIQSISTSNQYQYRVWENLDGNRFARPYTVPQPIGFPFENPNVDLGDFNGDGLPDIIRVRHTDIQILPGLGYGKFAPMIVIPFPDIDVTSFQEREEIAEKATFRDMSGDGLDDLTVEQPVLGQLWYWVNLGNYTFAPLRRVIGVPAGVGQNAAFRWADLNGNGTTDFVFADIYDSPRLQVFDLGEAFECVPAPNLLTRIDNGKGQVISIGYTDSTEFMIEDAANDAPWQYTLPFSIDVVSLVSTTDSLGGQYDLEVRYRDGYYSPSARFFTGFGEAVERDLGDDVAPTLVTRTRFDVGAENLTLRGTLIQLLQERTDGAVLYDEQTEWTARPLYTGTDGNASTFNHKTRVVRDTYEAGVGTPRRTVKEYEYDDYGNEVLERDFGVVEGDDVTALADEALTVTQIGVNEDLWIIHEPIRREVQALDGTVVARTDFHYDDFTFSGELFGDVGTATLTMEQRWADPQDESSIVTEGRFEYDVYGNIVTMLDGLAVAPDGAIDESTGHVRRIEYDEAFRVYPVSETIYIGGGEPPLTVEAAYDEGFGTVTVATNFNGHQTRYEYDTYGRLVRSYRPGDEDDFPSMEYRYGLAAPVGESGLVNYVETRLLDTLPGEAGDDSEAHYFVSRQYLDGLGRTLMTKTEAEPAPGEELARAVVSGAVRFHGRGGVAEILQPHFSTAPAESLDGLLAFEDVNADGWEGAFHVNGETQILDLANAPRTQSFYDELERIVRSVKPGGVESRREYEPLLTRSFDENDADPESPHANTPMVAYTNGSGQVHRVDEVTLLTDDGELGDTPQTWTTTYVYREDGVLVTITDAQGNVRTFEHDGLKRKTRTGDINRGDIFYAYDAASNMSETIDAKGQTTRYTYDGANRLRTVDYLDEGTLLSAGRSYDPEQPLGEDNRPDVLYGYDVPVPGVPLGDGTLGAAGNTAGELAWVRDLAGETHFSYDARGNGAYVTKRIPDPVSGLFMHFTTRMEFDPMDRVSAIRYPDGDRVAYTYNARNLGDAITAGDDAIVSAMVYGPASQRTAMTLGNGVSANYAYDTRGRLNTLSAMAGGTAHLDYAYDFDKAANVLAIRDRRPLETYPFGDPRRNSQYFTYDDRYRMTNAQVSFAGVEQNVTDDGQIAYRYDRIGNLISKTSPLDVTRGGIPLTNVGTIAYGGEMGASGRAAKAPGEPGPNAPTSTENEDGVRTLTYDDNGNLIAFDGLTANYDYADRLGRLEDETMVARYTYDYAGRRIIKAIWAKANGPAEDRVPDQYVLYPGKHFEIREHEQPTKYVYHGDTRIAKVTGTLDPATERVQRVRLSAGWNLIVVVVDAADMAAQLGIGQVGRAAYRWDIDAEEYVALNETDELPAGSLLWLNVDTAELLALRGAYAGLSPDAAAFVDGYLALASLETLDANRVFGPSQPALWSHGDADTPWRARQPGTLAFLSDLSRFIRPGQAVFVQSAEDVTVELPPASRGIQYYIQDHLGSSNVVLDGVGNLVEETVFYPFGEPRFRSTGESFAEVTQNPYLFTQKERDRESGLHYFEERYLLSPLGRFTRVDPVVEDLPDEALADPQLLNAYSYARNNPIAYQDPDGRFLTTALLLHLSAKRNPFGSVEVGGDSSTKAERRARVFGELQSPKGESLPKGSSLTPGRIPDFVQKDIDKLRTDSTISPNTLLSTVASVAEKLDGAFVAKDRPALGIKKILNIISSAPTGERKEEADRLDAFSELPFAFENDADVTGFTDSGREINENIAKQVELLRNTLKSLDLNAKFEEFSKILEKQEFKFDQEQVDSFVDRFLKDDEERVNPRRDNDASGN